MLRSPVMVGLAVDKALEQKNNKLRTAISRLSTLQAHNALVILRIPKLMYTMRTASCHGNARLIEFDNALKDGLSSILNVNLTEDQWNQASVPVRDGGLGIRSSASLATSAFFYRMPFYISMNKSSKILVSSGKHNLDRLLPTIMNNTVRRLGIQNILQLLKII